MTETKLSKQQKAILRHLAEYDSSLGFCINSHLSSEIAREFNGLKESWDTGTDSIPIQTDSFRASFSRSIKRLIARGLIQKCQFIFPDLYKDDDYYKIKDKSKTFNGYTLIKVNDE